MNYEKNTKIVFTSLKDEKYIDLFTITGVIKSYNKTKKTASIIIDEPDIINENYVSISKNNIITGVPVVYISDINSIDIDTCEFLNKGKHILKTVNCYGNLLKFLDKIKTVINEKNINIIIQTIAYMDLALFESEEMILLQTDIISLLYSEDFDLKKFVEKIEIFEEFIKNKQKMLN